MGRKSSVTMVILLFIFTGLLIFTVVKVLTLQNPQLPPTVLNAPNVGTDAPPTTENEVLRLRVEVDNLKAQSDEQARGQLSAFVPTLLWVILAVLVMVGFAKPLHLLAENIAQRSSNSTIELNGFRLGVNEAGNAIEGQEVLRIALKLSNADQGDAEIKELQFIGALATTMSDGREYLSPENKARVLSIAIDVALIDAEFSQSEYEEILIQANRYGYSGEDIDKLHDEMILKMLVRRHRISPDDGLMANSANDVIPPPRLKNRYEAAKLRLDNPVR